MSYLYFSCVGCPPDFSVVLFPVMFNMDFSYSLQFDLSTLDNFLLRSAVEILFGSFIIKLLQLSTIFFSWLGFLFVIRLVFIGVFSLHSLNMLYVGGVELDGHGH